MENEGKDNINNSKSATVLKDKDKKEVLEDVEDIEGIEDDVLSDLEKKALEHDLEP